MTLQYSLLDEPLIRARLVDGGQLVQYSLPGLFMALARDEVRDFPALRPHQRHPWHAFLVQLAAMALHHAGRDQPFETEQEWKNALLALTSEHPDGAAWCLITPHDKPAFMQAPVPGGNVSDWKNTLYAPDELDMLVTSKNHDLKAARMRGGELDDWVMALISLQTQEGYGGRDNWGISRMAGGFGCRVAMGAVPKGNVGQRWRRDLVVLLNSRQSVVDNYGFETKSSNGLLWLLPWDGSGSLAFSSLDPFYIEICRRIRLVSEDAHVLYAKTTTSKEIRVASNNGKGGTGDAWTPIDGNGEALKIRANGFSYDLAVALLFGNEYRKNSYRQPATMTLIDSDGDDGIFAVMQAISRGGPMGNKSVTEGYHERRIPISRKVRNMLRQNQTDYLAKVAGERVHAIGQLRRRVLWTALATLFNQGADKDFSDSTKDKAGVFAKTFEQAEDVLFFEELNAEIDSEEPDSTRLQWLLSMVGRAEIVLKKAFVTGPQSSEQRYRARSAALDKFRGLVNQEFPTLADHYRRQLTLNKEIANESA